MSSDNTTQPILAQIAELESRVSIVGHHEMRAALVDFALPTAWSDEQACELYKLYAYYGYVSLINKLPERKVKPNIHDVP
jgi:hypothetical protein